MYLSITTGITSICSFLSTKNPLVAGFQEHILYTIVLGIPQNGISSSTGPSGIADLLATLGALLA